MKGNWYVRTKKGKKKNVVMGKEEKRWRVLWFAIKDATNDGTTVQRYNGATGKGSW